MLLRFLPLLAAAFWHRAVVVDAVTVASQDFDGGDTNLLAASSFDPSTDSLDGGRGKWFGVGSIAAWPQSQGLPFVLADDSVTGVSGGSAFAADTEGVYGQESDPNNLFFGVANTPDFGTPTATWVFDVAGFTDLQISIDMGGISNPSLGGYGTATSVTFTVMVDDATQTAFDLTAVDNDSSFVTRPMDNNAASGGGRLLEVTGDNPVTKVDVVTGGVVTNTYLDKSPASGEGAGGLDTFMTSISSTGSTLTLTLTANIPFEGMAFDNIVVTGSSSAGDTCAPAMEDFDGGATKLLAGFDTIEGNVDGGGGKWFGVGAVGSWPQSTGIPWSLVDETVADLAGRGVVTSDTEGIFGENRGSFDNFFGLSDTQAFSSTTASWTFDISDLSDIELSIDMGGISNSDFSGYNSATSIQFTTSIDGGIPQLAFDIAALFADDDYTARPMDSGGSSGGGRVLEVSGDGDVSKILADFNCLAPNTYLDKSVASGSGAGDLDTFTTNISGAGSTLTLTMTAFLPFEAMAFDNIKLACAGQSPLPCAPPGPGPIPCPATSHTIMEIQGKGHTSPFVSESVVTTGVVTAVVSGQAFYLQDPDGDDDIATSDAIYVVSSQLVAVGDGVQVFGEVMEFTARSLELSRTQIQALSVSVVSTGNVLPDPVMIGESGRLPPSENIDDDDFAVFDPETSGLDFFESLESMLVTIEDAMAVSGTSRFGEIFTVANRGASATGISARGTLTISPDDFNPEKVQIDKDGRIFDFEFPVVDVGALLGSITGVVGYDFGNFQIHPTMDFTPNILPSSIEPTVTTLTDSSRLTIATYNVLNLDPNDDDGDTDIALGRFALIAQHIVTNMGSPCIIGLQEVQDNSGSVDDGVTSASETLQLLVDEIITAGGPTYSYIDNTFINDKASGGQPGGNIRVAFLYDSGSVDLVPDSVRPVRDQEIGSPFLGARLPLAADFTFKDQLYTVINNHFSSKGGSAPIMGIEQPFEERQEDLLVNGSWDERKAQSEAVQAFISTIMESDQDARVVILGDFNELQFVSPVSDFESNLGFYNLMRNLRSEERYSYIFQGNSQALDHILVSDNIRSEGVQFEVIHVNSEFAETSTRASDHDPLLLQIGLIEFNFCFSGAATVEVEHVGTTTIDQIEIGDRVLVNDGVYEEVYGFGHRSEKMSTFLQILPSGLEVTADHLVFIENGQAVPASSIRVGDVLFGGETAVTEVKTVTRRGFYAPFTKSGTLMVNGILVSSYVAFQPSEHLHVAGLSTGLSFHWLSHKATVLRRLQCQVFGSCSSETYNDQGLVTWAETPLKMTKWFVSADARVQAALSIPLGILVAALAMLDFLLSRYNSVTVVTVAMAGALYCCLERSKDVKNDRV